MTNDAAATASRPEATGRLTIDLGAVRANYRHLANQAVGAECAAVVKADAYGTGAEKVAPALAREGCRTFFVATLDEAAKVRRCLPDARIYALDGLFPGSAPLFAANTLRPVLGSLAEVEEWAAFCRAHGVRLPAAVHIDTGMNRLGLPAREVDSLAARTDWLASFELSLVMSHLACADDPDHPMSETQRTAFDALKAKLPTAPASLANSAGIMAGPAYHYDLVRAGVALYGGQARSGGANPMAPVVRLDGRIVQIRTVEAGESIGYGATYRAKTRMAVATVSIGYADGFFRLLSACEPHGGAIAYVGDHAAPLVGRVSMDLVTLDVSDVPAGLAERGAFVELVGPHVSVDDLAQRAKTIGYEVLTSLGTRVHRVYLDGNG